MQTTTILVLEIFTDTFDINLVVWCYVNIFLLYKNISYFSLVILLMFGYKLLKYNIFCNKPPISFFSITKINLKIGKKRII